MATTFVEVTHEQADELWKAGLLWSKFLGVRIPRWRHDPYSIPLKWYESAPSSWGVNWKFAIQVED